MKYQHRVKICIIAIGLISIALLNSCSSKLRINSSTSPAVIDLVFFLEGQKEFYASLSGENADTNSLTYQLVDNTTKGTVELTNPSTGTFHYSASADATGIDTFTFSARKNNTISNVAKVTLVLDEAGYVEYQKSLSGGGPIAEDGTLETEETLEVEGKFVATDPQDKPLIFWIDSPPQHGTVDIIHPFEGTFSYTPHADFHGTDSFTFRAGNGKFQSDIANITITVSPETFAFQNPANPCDVNGDGYVSPVDSLLIINALNAGGPYEIERGSSAPSGTYYDAYADNQVNAADAEFVINYLNIAGIPPEDRAAHICD